MRVPNDGLPDMAQALTYYDYDFYKSSTWWFTRDEIGRGLRERYQVPKELPPKILALVSKLAVENNQSPRSRTLLKKLDAVEGNYLSR